jgi:hypothetical protein
MLALTTGTRLLRTSAPLALMLAIGAVAYPSTGTDDSYITYWPAHTLAHFGSIVNVNGERVEQSSSLLWTVVLAIASRLTRIDVESLGVPLSVLAGVATVGVTGVLARRIDPRAEERARWLVALSFPSLLWSFSGMETAMAALLWTALAAWSIPYVFAGGGRGARWTSIAALGAFLLVRPEAPLTAFAAFAAIAGVTLALSAGRPALRDAAGRAALLLAIGLAVAGAIALFRHAYFGSWVPQPVLAKVSSSSSSAAPRLFQGLLYVVGFESVRGSQPPGWPNRIEVGMTVASALAVGAIALKRFAAAARSPANANAAEQAAFAAAVFLLAALSFPVAAGGDWMGGWRFLCTPLPCAIALLACALSRLSRRTALTVSGAAVAYELLVLGRTATMPGLALPLWLDVPQANRAYPFFVRHNVPHLRDAAFLPAIRAAVSHTLATEPRVTILSGQAGYVVSHLGEAYFGRLRFLDRVSLVTRDLEDCPLLTGTTTDVGFSITSTAPLFDPASRVHEECGLPLPDVVFDSGRRELFASMLASGAYRVVFEEGTEMLPPGSALTAARTYQYLGVRSLPGR